MSTDAQLKADLDRWKRRLSAREARQRRAGKLVASARAAVRRRERMLRKPPTLGALIAQRALKEAGVTESPANSNRGPKVSAYQAPFGLDAQPWCGSFVGWVILQVTGKAPNRRIVYTPYLLHDAKERLNGWTFVPTERILRGDAVLMDFKAGGDPVMHVGIATHPFQDGQVKTVEGNTSAGSSGSQDNGGGVYCRVRPASVIVGAARWVGGTQ